MEIDLNLRPVALNSFVWGPKMWNLLHSATLAGTPDAGQYHRLLTAFAVVCPCKVCRESFAEVMARAPPESDNLGVYTWRLHNAVNDKLGKNLVTFRNVKKRYESCPSPLSANDLWDTVYPIAKHSASKFPQETLSFVQSAVSLASTLHNPPHDLLTKVSHTKLMQARSPVAAMREADKLQRQLVRACDQHKWKQALVYPTKTKSEPPAKKQKTESSSDSDEYVFRHWSPLSSSSSSDSEILEFAPAGPDDSTSESLESAPAGPDDSTSESLESAPAGPDDSTSESLESAPAGPDDSTSESLESAPAGPDDSTSEDDDIFAERPEESDSCDKFVYEVPMLQVEATTDMTKLLEQLYKKISALFESEDNNLKFVCHTLCLCLASILNVNQLSWRQYAHEHNCALQSVQAELDIQAESNLEPLRRILAKPVYQQINRTWKWVGSQGSMIYDCQKKWEPSLPEHIQHLFSDMEIFLREFKEATPGTTQEDEKSFEDKMLAKAYYGYLMQRTDPVMRAIAYCAS